MLLEVGIGDSYGHGFEYVDPSVVMAYNTGYKYRQHPLHDKVAPGDYTDDTQMTLGVFSYLYKHGNKQDSLLMFTEWYKHFKQDPIDGYSRGLQSVLEAVQSPKELEQVIGSHNKSDKNGGAMRAIPCCLLPTTEQVKEFSGWQASLTHQGTGVLAAQAAALSGFYFRKNIGDKFNLGKWLNDTLGVNEVWEWYTKVKSPTDLGLITVKAAIMAVILTENYKDCLIESCAFTGDVDTVAAIAMGIASQDKTRTDDLPEGLKRDLRKCPVLELYSAQELNLELMLMTE
jgi:ADP-ribosylglycohydrolase